MTSPDDSAVDHILEAGPGVRDRHGSGDGYLVDFARHSLRDGGGDDSDHWESVTVTQMRVEIEGSADEVVRILWPIGSAGREAPAVGVGGSTETPTGSGVDASSATGTPGVAGFVEPAPGEWTEALAGEFLAVLEPAARRTALHVWRAGDAGIHRSVLCQLTELTRTELGSLMMRMGHALRRFQREHGVTLSRPVADNSPLQSYFVDPGFAAVATSDAFGDVGRA